MLFGILPLLLGSFSERFGPFDSFVVIIDSTDDIEGLAQGHDLILKSPKTFVTVVDAFGNIGNFTASDLVICLALCKIQEDALWSWLVSEKNHINLNKLRMNSNVYVFKEDAARKEVLIRETYGLKGGQKVFNNYLGKWSSETGGKIHKWVYDK